MTNARYPGPLGKRVYCYYSVGARGPDDALPAGWGDDANSRKYPTGGRHLVNRETLSPAFRRGWYRCTLVQLRREALADLSVRGHREKNRSTRATAALARALLFSCSNQLPMGNKKAPPKDACVLKDADSQKW